ncbi:MAG: GUN4 domain-containing protein [Dolichospermum lemmermannii FEM_B0920]
MFGVREVRSIEQYRDKGNFGPHTDVYALAATLYYLLTADGLKRDSKSTPAPAYKREKIKIFDFLVKPKVYNQSLSQRVNDAILQGMELEPENRTPTVLKFRENLGLVNIENEQEIQLKSAVRINYTKLRDLLAAQNWKEADKETYEVMIQAVGKTSGDWFTSNELLNFPCQDLRTIDQLWVKYSKGGFGFSVQKEIYLSVGGKLRRYEDEAFSIFCRTVGWEWDSINYDSGKRGYFPTVGSKLRVGFASDAWVSLFSHRDL